MSGIVVGIDGSHKATPALNWAMAEAALRKTDLTVIAVNSVPAGYWSGTPVTLAGDEERVARSAVRSSITRSARWSSFLRAGNG